MGASDRFSKTIRKDQLGSTAQFELRPLASGRRATDTTALSPRASEAERQQDGYAAGKAQGLAEAQRLAQQARAADLQRLEALLAGLQAQFDELAGRAADNLLDLAVDIAAQVLRQELQVRPEALLPVVREAMALVSAAHVHPSIHLAPQDFERVRAALQADGQFHGCRFLSDPAIGPGGCRVVSSHGEVDATLPTRWRRVLQTLGLNAPAPQIDPPAAAPAAPAQAGKS
jgi:flagellar assembly protein FliH